MNAPKDAFGRSPDNSLTIFRPVLNIGEVQADSLKERLARSDDLREMKLLRNILRPARKPKAELIAAPEFKRVLRAIGVPAVNEDYLEELKEHMDSALASLAEGHTPATLPAKVGKTGRGNFLNIAASPAVVQERKVAKQAIAEYYGLTEIPGTPWNSDAAATAVWLARTYQEHDREIVDRLGGMLAEDPSLLPQRTELGEVKVMPVIPE